MDKALSSKIDYAQVGEAISHELAAKMIKNYQDFRPNDVASYHIGRNIIEQILAQPGCVSIRFFNAIDEAGRQTLVYVGVDAKGNNIIAYPAVDEMGKLGKVEALAGDKTLGEIYWW